MIDEKVIRNMADYWINMGCEVQEFNQEAFNSIFKYMVEYYGYTEEEESPVAAPEPITVPRGTRVQRRPIEWTIDTTSNPCDEVAGSSEPRRTAMMDYSRYIWEETTATTITSAQMQAMSELLDGVSASGRI